MVNRKSIIRRKERANPQQNTPLNRGGGGGGGGGGGEEVGGEVIAVGGMNPFQFGFDAKF